MSLLPFEYAYRNIGRSRVRLVASVCGSGLVVLLVLASAGFARGMHRTLATDAPMHRNVIILGAGSEEALERSQIDASVESIAAASIPGLRTETGVIFASPEIHIALPVRTSDASTADLQAIFRGVRPVAMLVHPEVEIIDGRAPHPGRDEIIVGSLAGTRLGIPDRRLDLGQTLHFDHRDWTVVGRFSAPNTVMDAEIWIPLVDLQVATRREASLSCVVVTLDTATFSDVDLFAKSRLDLEITALPEVEYYSSIAAFYGPIRMMVLITAALIATGGLLGGLNTMYASFASRVREIGSLQALGFTRPAIALNFVQESVFLAACGTLFGLVFGYALLDGLAIRFSMGAFELAIDPIVILAGLLGGLAVGAIGAVPPVIRCLKLPITEALRAF